MSGLEAKVTNLFCGARVALIKADNIEKVIADIDAHRGNCRV
jgi:hypothetical protein